MDLNFGLKALAYLYLLAEGSDWAARYFAVEARLPNPEDEQGLRIHVLTWLFNNNHKASATEYAKHHHLDHIIQKLIEDDVAAGGGGGGGGGGGE